MPIDAGHLHWNQVHELSDVLLGHIPGRESDNVVNLLKSVGLGIQDIALAAKVYEAATKAGAGTVVPL